MTQRVVVRALSVSLDGYSAGPNQSLDNPLGVGGPDAFNWFFHTRTWTKMQGLPDGETGIDDEMSVKAFENLGAWIMGRNMFGPVREAWPNEDWKGWWGDEPPYHVPVYVLTHHPRASFALSDTTFHFVTNGIESALEQAKKAAKGKDIRIGGGAATIRQFLKARLIDELHLVISPALLGSGESIFHPGINLRELGYECVKHVAGNRAVAHVVLQKKA